MEMTNQYILILASTWYCTEEWNYDVLLFSKFESIFQNVTSSGEKEEISWKAQNSARFYKCLRYTAMPSMFQSCASRHIKIFDLLSTSLHRTSKRHSKKKWKMILKLFLQHSMAYSVIVQKFKGRTKNVFWKSTAEIQGKMKDC